MRIRVKLTYRDGTWEVNLPDYKMVPDSWRPVTPGVLDPNSVRAGVPLATVRALRPSVEVDVPDCCVSKATGRPDPVHLRATYKEHPRFGARDFTSDTEDFAPVVAVGSPA